MIEILGKLTGLRKGWLKGSKAEIGAFSSVQRVFYESRKCTPEHRKYPETLSKYNPIPPQDIPQALFMHQLKSTETSCTNRHSLTSPDPPRCCLRMAEAWKCLLTSPGVFWYVLASFVVWICLVMSEVGVGWGLWVYMSDVYGYLRCLQVSGGLYRCSSLEWWRIHTVLA